MCYKWDTLLSLSLYYNIMLLKIRKASYYGGGEGGESIPRGAKAPPGPPPEINPDMYGMMGTLPRTHNSRRINSRRMMVNTNNS